MLQDVLNFCEKHQNDQPVYEPLNGNLVDHLYNSFAKSHIGHLAIPSIKVPAQEILDEMLGLRSKFVAHPPDDYHQGRNFFVIYGKDETYLPYNAVHNVDETKLDVSGNSWVAQDVAPFTTNYFKNIFPADNYNHILVMLLEPGGWIAPHTDTITQTKMLNVPLNLTESSKAYNVQGCIPYVVGEVMIINTSVTHAICNMSNQDRYVISVGCNYNNEFRKKIIETYLLNRKRSLQASR
jgi:hypothetical protein